MAKQIFVLMFAAVSLHAFALEPLRVDPTAPPNRTVIAAPQSVVVPEFALTALMAGMSNSWAIINGQRVGVGDEIGGAKVVQIEKGGVELMVADEPVWLSLDTGFKKRSTP